MPRESSSQASLNACKTLLVFFCYTAFAPLFFALFTQFFHRRATFLRRVFAPSRLRALALHLFRGHAYYVAQRSPARNNIPLSTSRTPATTVQPMPGGRPSLYSPELAELICDRIASGETLTVICAEETMPGYSTVSAWLLSDMEFRAKYAQARKTQADYFAEDTLRLSDTATAENAQAVRLQVDARKWFAGKMHAEKYGDAPASVNVAVGVSVQTATVSDRAEHVRAKLARKGLLPAPAQHAENEQVKDTEDEN